MQCEITCLLSIEASLAQKKKKNSVGKVVPSDDGYFIKQLVRVPEGPEG